MAETVKVKDKFLPASLLTPAEMVAATGVEDPQMLTYFVAGLWRVCSITSKANTTAMDSLIALYAHRFFPELGMPALPEDAYGDGESLHVLPENDIDVPDFEHETMATQHVQDVYVATMRTSKKRDGR
ncbi:PREDICTED: uncharacterized protein LOC106816472 [Priapulus caudatus]|uniref:Uncharacterized protein LOC106816472 n=1 Tax=Priapulus caudatus TaxID=37621 RepID=A0ABM1EWK7_PRICU|nr:PREDICTED: uncharacterized protein LOC106816472 [Priapulus caudatus]